MWKILPALVFLFSSNLNIKVLGALNQNHTVLERTQLKKDIFENYDKQIISDNVTVKFGIALVHLEATPESNYVEISAWLRFVWNDNRLTWDRNLTGRNVELLRLPNDQVWKPDIVLYNSYDTHLFPECAPSHVLIYPNGEILWVPPCKFKVLCDMQNLRKDPTATQICLIKFGSWTHDGLTVDLKLYNDKAEVDLSDHWDISKWKIVGHNATVNVKTYDCCPEPYTDISFYIEFQNKETMDYPESESSSGSVVILIVIVILLILVGTGIFVFMSRTGRLRSSSLFRRGQRSNSELLSI